MPDSSLPILQMRGISKAFSGTAVLRAVDLDVPRGSIVALLGVSGSGKTTLLQVIAGLLVPDAGTLLIDGVDMAGVPAFLRPVNMMFQSYALFPHLTVANNIAYGLKAAGTARAERERLVSWALELTRLTGLGGRRPDQLSGGQRQRVALARCLVLKPSVLLLDEPLAALDRSLRTAVQKQLIAIQRAVGTTFVLVTHDQEEAMGMSDYVAVVDKGRILQFGTPRELYERPRSRFVASFLGTINLFEGKVIPLGGGSIRVDAGDATEVVADCDRELMLPECVVGFRPEKVVVARETTGLPNDFLGTVEQVSYGGNLSHVTIRLASRRVVEATVLNSLRSVDVVLERGESVHVGFPPDAAVVLPT